MWSVWPGRRYAVPVPRPLHRQRQGLRLNLGQAGFRDSLYKLGVSRR